MSFRYKIKIAYDGTNYFGWQVQPHHHTIQGEMETFLSEMVSQKVRLESSGRTDAGVHARGQVAHFDLEMPISNLSTFRRGLNAQLDSAIRVLTLERVSPSFHARFDAVGKEYRYFIYNGKILPPTKRFYRLHETRSLNLEQMQKAATLLMGEHDFAPFAANRKIPQESTVRTIYSFDLHKHGSDLTLRVRGNGFLYKMVRSLAGFLIDVGRGKLKPDDAKRILESGERTARVQTARPQGLFLWKVFY
jgi:tRNA pseudouridine38-40 synthase